MIQSVAPGSRQSVQALPGATVSSQYTCDLQHSNALTNGKTTHTTYKLSHNSTIDTWRVRALLKDAFPGNIAGWVGWLVVSSNF